MIDQPDADAILHEVEAALREGIAPGFAQKVTANAVALVRRERAMKTELEAAERERLSALLGRDGPIEDLTAALSSAIRARSIGAGSEALIAHLRETARAKLEVDQPAYPPYRARQEP